MRFYILTGIILAACNTNSGQSDSLSSQDDEINKMIMEDSFDIDTNIAIGASVLSDSYKTALTRIALKPLPPDYNLKNLSFENAEDVYFNLLKTYKLYNDSGTEKLKHLDSIFKEIELENGKLEQSDEYPIELKLKIASIKSDIHFLRSNRQLKKQQQ
jgi:hypothetical protein